MYTDEQYEDGQDDESPEQETFAHDVAQGAEGPIIAREPIGFLTEQPLNK
jgi:hypothetical protein